MNSRVANHILDGFQALFFLALVFLAAPLIGAETFSGVFLVRCLTLGGAFFLLIKFCFFGTSLLEKGQKYLHKCLAFFIVFLIYSSIQWLGKGLVHTRVLPGTLAPFRTIDLTIQLIFYLLFFFSALDFFVSKKKFEIFTWVVWVQLGLLVALGFWQGFGPYKVSEEMFRFIEMPRSLRNFYASFPNPNHIGAYFSIASAFLVISIVHNLESFRKNELSSQEILNTVVYFLLLPALILSEIYAQARTGFFLHLIFIFVFTLLAVPRAHRSMVAIGLIFLGGAYLILMKASPIVFPLEPFFKDIHKGLNYRFAIAGDAIHIFFNYPIFGTGLGSCKYVSAIFQKLDAEDLKWYTVINHHLELLFSSGIVGYILFTVPLVTVVLHYAKRAKRCDSYQARIYGLGAFIAIALTGTLGSYIDDFLSVPCIALLFLAHLAVLVNAGSGVISEPPESLKRPGSAFLVFLLGLLVLSALGFYAFNTYAAQRHRIDSIDSSRAVAILEKSVARRPDYPEAWAQLGFAYEERALLEFRLGYDPGISTAKAIEAHKRAIELTPLWSRGWLYLGRAQVLAGEHYGALQSLHKATELAPYNRDLYLYVLATQLKIAAQTKDPSLRARSIAEARAVVERTRKIQKPITQTDYRYVGERNRHEHIELQADDLARIKLFLDEVGSD